MAKLLKILNQFTLFQARFSYDFLALFFSFLLFYNYKNLFSLDLHSELTNFMVLCIFVISILFFALFNKFLSNSFLKKCFVIYFTNVIIYLILFGVNYNETFFKFVFLFVQLQIIARFFSQNIFSDANSILKKVINVKGPILIIGGAGYIGSHLIEILITNNKKVRVLDNFMYGKDSIKKYAKTKNLQVYEAECHDIVKLIPAMEGCSAVVHLAGLVGDPACAVSPELTRYTNILSTRITFLIAKSLGVNKFIFASSCSVYGVSDKKVNEKSKLNPVSLYAQTKIDSEKELLNLSNEDKNISLTILRFATVFGHSPRSRFDLVANIFASNVARGKEINVFGPNQWRPFIHVYDVANSINTVLNAKVSLVKNEIFNVGTNSGNITLGDLATKVRDIAIQHGISSKKIKVNMIKGKPSDMRNYMVSFDKISSKLNFKSSFTLEKGIAEIINNFKLKIYGNPDSSKYSNLKTTQKYLKRFSKKESGFEKLPITYL